MRRCPVDDFTLKPQKYEGVEIDTCPHCAGVWLDAGELEALQNTQDSDFRDVPIPDAEKVLAAEDMARAAHEASRTCVSCKAELVKKEYAFASQVMVDQCPNGHGLWLDKGELARLEMFFEDEQDFAEILAEMEQEGQGLGAFLSRLWGSIRG